MDCGLHSKPTFQLLREVSRPGRYFDHEINFPQKREGRLKFLLCFPDLYEIGMSNMGVRILYHVINRHPDFLADLAFAPWVDMEAFMRREGLPLTGLGTGIRAGEFDVLGFSLQHELQYTNVLTMLDLAGMSVTSAGRGNDDPIVIAGGPCAFNPEPMSEFIDAFAIGDGERVSAEIASKVLEARSGGAPRTKVLEMLTEIAGVYVPRVQAGGGPSLSIARRVESELREDDFPLPPIVPIAPITHDRLTLEIMRGCTRGCRFCSAGMLTRPVRQRHLDSLVRLAQAGIEASGWEEVSLVSLSTSDYSDLAGLVSKLTRVFSDQHVGISLPSMRPGTFSDEIAKLIGATRRTGLTFAPEAGSATLRRAINKDIDESDLYATVETAFKNKWNSVKLYFMIGLPGECESDMGALVSMVRAVESICRGYGRRKRITVSLSPFVPRPHTPFQWEAQLQPAAVLERISYVRKRLPDRRVVLKWRDPYMALLEGLLARADKAFSRPILGAWRAGARFDGWTDQFSFDLWKRCLDREGVSVARGAGPREKDQSLPWDYIAGGVSRRFLIDEARRSAAAELTPDCRTSGCHSCGACPGSAAITEEPQDRDGAVRIRPEARPKARRSDVRIRFRVRYSKGEAMRFASHLDTMRCIQRGLRRARVPVCYSAGFSPHPRISFGPPLPLGVTGNSEYLDILFSRMPPEGWLDAVNTYLPGGLAMIESRIVGLQSPSLMSTLNAARYSVVVSCDSGVSGRHMTEEITKAVEVGGKIFSLRSSYNDDKLIVEMKVGLATGSPRPEKVLESTLRDMKVCYEITREDLFVEKNGVFQSAFAAEK